MFTLGLEFNFAKLSSMRKFVFGLGAAQVAVTAGLICLILMLIPGAAAAWLFPGFDWRLALVVSAALTMSSTALVTKLLVDRREFESEHGRRIFSVLLFQDLAVIPLLVIIPALAQGTEGLGLALSLAFLKAAFLLVLLLKFGPRLMRQWFGAVVRSRSHELFTLNVLLASLLFAWLTRQAGLSMELGAFVAGMLIAETEFRYQVEEDIKPFRDVLLGLFFVTIGARLDLGSLSQSWPQVILLLIASLVLKAAVIVALVRAFGDSVGVAIRTGLWLSQTGEFAFVLLALAFDGGLIELAALQPLLAAILLSLLVSPFVIGQAGRLTMRVSNQEWMLRSLELQQVASRSVGRRDHVIVCGFGRCGQSLAHVLETEGVSFVALDTDPDRVREAAEAGEPVVYGDATRAALLQAAGIHRARALAITFDDYPQAIRLLHTVRQIAPQLPVIVRTTNEADIARLRDAGATEVVPEIAEGSLVIASHAMALAGVPMARVRRRMRTVREGRYALLQGFFHGADDREVEDIEHDHLHLHAVPIGEQSAAIGRPLGATLDEGVRVTALVRAGARILDPAADTVLAPGDVVVLSGRRDRIGNTEARLNAAPT
jgi:CPA2 family monovalent cation:H+ antiporter-2